MLLNIKHTWLHNKWHYTSQVHVTCNRLPTATHTHTAKYKLVFSHFQWNSALIMIFFMNGKISFAVICYNGKIYVPMSNLMTLRRKQIPVVTWTLTRNVLTGCHISWLQAGLDCMAQRYLQSRTGNSMLYVGVHVIRGIGDILMSEQKPMCLVRQMTLQTSALWPPSIHMLGCMQAACPSKCHKTVTALYMKVWKDSIR